MERALDVLRAEGFTVEARSTNGPGSAGEVARAAAEGGASLVIAYGGDGTINETAAGLTGTGVPLAILPGGTANVLANELRLPGSAEQVARELSAYRPVRIAAGQLCVEQAAPRLFLLMAGAGLDAHIVEHLPLEFKRRWGKFGYWIGGFRQLGRTFEEFDVTVAGRTFRASFALFSRVRNYGGDLEIARHVTLLDDDFEILLFSGSSSLRYLRYFGAVLLNRLESTPGVTVLRAREAEIAPATGVFLQVDGEAAGRVPARIRIIPDALTMLIPPGYLNRRTA